LLIKQEICLIKVLHRFLKLSLFGITPF